MEKITNSIEPDRIHDEFAIINTAYQNRKLTEQLKFITSESSRNNLYDHLLKRIN